MKKFFIILFISCFSLTACAPNFGGGGQQEIVQETTNNSEEKAIIPKDSISDSYYKMILPFKPGKARGLITERLNTRLDIDEFETGLMRVAQETFPISDDYLYQEGQYLEEDTVKAWLKRKLTPEEFEEAQKAAKDKKDKKPVKNLGLNPPAATGGTAKENNEKSPIYLAHMLEHNYLVRKGDNTVELGGVVIGLALNSVHYYNEEHGYPREYNITKKEIEEKGKEIASEVLSRVRSMKGLEKVPIVIALYQQEGESSIVPGNFISKTVVKGDSIGKWESINEQHVFFPSEAATKTNRDDATTFNRFKADIDEFFPNYTGVIGKAFYKNDELQTLKIEIPMQFYGKAEVIAFTQFIKDKVTNYFPKYIELEVNISSSNGQEALILLSPDDEKPTVHIYN
ncbi:CamS family sex pheromone protein [Metabacillus fastidiosus]|uniref:CamS family sex pheromone protein n=1 Tax=Metabacillus fastidiosus TaxID=1458 RepID=A0ABU6NZ81_9BACI|nr:CamS family sex pheromone protein [Metabacillus fastidiosus]MED4402013.1 CamS family sex pheromone protein [Metabacillus fastidiosus]MED4460854.1 CamS family sex pheromone protein [Metabacillus fastidiosus]